MESTFSIVCADVGGTNARFSHIRWTISGSQWDILKKESYSAKDAESLLELAK